MIALVLLSLVTIQDPDIDALLKQLEDESIEVREKAAAALVDLGDKAEAKVRSRMEASEGELKIFCTKILERMSVPKKLAGVLPPLRKITIEAKDRSLKEVLEDLRAQTGMAMDLERLADSPVTVSFKNLTPMEALDAVCKAASLGYSVDSYGKYRSGKVMVAAGGPMGQTGLGSDPKVRFQPGGYVEVPRQFVRHYAIEPTNISMTKQTSFRGGPTSNAYLNLRVLWPPEVKPQAGTLAVTSIVDDKGRSLYDAPRNIQRFGGMNASIYNGLQSGVQMTYPESDAKSIASLKGTVTLKYVIEEKVLLFEAPDGPGPHKKEHNTTTVELLEFKAGDGLVTVKVMVGGKQGKPEGMEFLGGPTHVYPIRLKLENGAATQSSGMGYSSDGTNITYSMTFTGVPSKVVAVEFVADTVYHSDTVEFELKDIPLPK